MGDAPRMDTWVEKARMGDEEAFRRLYDAHVERVHRLAWRMCGEEELARDLTQETFVRAFRAIEGFQGRSAFGSWLHRVAVRTVLNGVRRQARHRNGRVALEDAPLQGSDPSAIGFHLRDRVRAAVGSLPEIYRVVLLLHDLEGWTHREIAEALEVEEGTSKARLSRARARLRRALGEDLLECVR